MVDGLSPLNFSNKYKCLFIHIPKIAGTSIKEVLELPGNGHPPWQYFVDKFPEQWQQYTTFSVVRNPWDRVVSAFTYAQLEKSYWHNNRLGPHPDYEILKGITLLECLYMLRDNRDILKHESWYPQWNWIAKAGEGKYEIMVDHVLRFESLDDDFKKLCGSLNIEPIELLQINVTGHKPYQDYYMQESQDLVASIYPKDIELFDYTFA